VIRFLEVATRDSLVARDGRPFGTGLRMRSLEWLYPSVAAGMVRTLLGRKKASDFSPEIINLLKQIAVAGPLPMFGPNLFFPAPQDIAVERSVGKNGEESRSIAWAARPQQIGEGEGTDLPAHLLPVLLPSSAPDFKPAVVPPFWSASKMTHWLLNASGTGFEPPPDPGDVSPKYLLQRGYFKIEKDERFHVSIEPGTYAAQESQLFKTVSLAIGDDVKIAVRAEVTPEFESYLADLDEWTAMGGERRLVRLSAAAEAAPWACPESIREVLEKTDLVRMVLASPALFQYGWRPGWIGDDGKGEFGGVKLQLVGAAVSRWRPVSGWSYEEPRGPKAALRLAPAGSVYFFKAEKDASLLANQWLMPVSDDAQTRRDGFGLALWGPWEHHG
jgi:CRISPR-associated protein Cmr3